MGANLGSVHILKTRLGNEDYQKLIRINNPWLHQFIAKYVDLCNPAKVFVCADSAEDIQYIREAAIRTWRRRHLPERGTRSILTGITTRLGIKKEPNFLYPRVLTSDPR